MLVLVEKAILLKITHCYPGHLTDLTGGKGGVVSKGALRAVPPPQGLS